MVRYHLQPTVAEQDIIAPFLYVRISAVFKAFDLLRYMASLMNGNLRLEKQGSTIVLLKLSNGRVISKGS